VKPVTCGEATSVCNCRASRGGWGGRARTVAQRNLGDPTWWWLFHQRLQGTNNLQVAVPGVGEAHSSEEAG